MSSMDHTYEAMMAFRHALLRFNESLSGSLRDMARHHEDVSAAWQDAARREYDETWHPLESIISRYQRVSAPDYERFLDEKLGSLDRYLHGNH